MGSIISTFLLYYGGIYPETSGYYFIGLFYGGSLALVNNTLWSFPMIIILNISESRSIDYYTSYISVLFLIRKTASFFLGTMLKDEYTMRGIFLFFTITIMVLLVIILIVFIILSLVQKYRDHKKVIDDPNLQFQAEPKLLTPRTTNTKNDIQEVEEQDKVPSLGKWALFWTFFTELILFIFSMVLLFILSGTLNLVLHFRFSTNENFKWIKAFYLPVMFILCVIALNIGFKTYLRKMISGIFFRKTRKLLGLTMKETIAECLFDNPHLCMATSALRANDQIWKALGTRNTTKDKKVALFVVPDDIFLLDETDRYSIRQLDAIDTDFKDPEIYSRTCSNGIIIINRAIKPGSDMKYFGHKNDLYLKRKYQGAVLNLKDMNADFHIHTFIWYCIFSIVPHFYRVIYKLICPSCNVTLTEDSISTLIRCINFICGYFILIPFILLWKECSSFLEKISDMVLIFKNSATSLIKVDKEVDGENVTIESLRLWDRQFQHLNDMIAAKIEYIKYLLVFGLGFSKCVSILFSTTALFVKFDVSNEIVQIVVLVIIMDVSVIKFLIQPSSVTSSELNNSGMKCLDAYHAFCAHINKPKVRDPAKLQELLKVKEVFKEIADYWVGYVKTGYLGLYMKSKTLQLGYMVNQAIFRQYVESDLYTVFPGILVFFLKQFQ